MGKCPECKSPKIAIIPIRSVLSNNLTWLKCEKCNYEWKSKAKYTDNLWIALYDKEEKAKKKALKQV